MEALGLKRVPFAKMIKASSSAVDQWRGKRGGYKSVYFERIWEALKLRGIDPNDVRRRAIEGIPKAAPDPQRVLRSLTPQQVAILDTWNQIEENPQVFAIIEAILITSKIRPPSKRRGP